MHVFVRAYYESMHVPVPACTTYSYFGLSGISFCIAFALWTAVRGHYYLFYLPGLVLVVAATAITTPANTNWDSIGLDSSTRNEETTKALLVNPVIHRLDEIKKIKKKFALLTI